MALLDVLQARTDRRHRTAQVSCGEPGLLTVEVIPPVELARLQHDRAVLYAACRELQSAGETLRKAGKLFAPDEITAYLSDDEAASGAWTVREISGVSGSRRDFGIGTDTVSEGQDGSDSLTESGEIRLDAVQAENNVYSETRHARKSGSPRVRPNSVQEDGGIRTSVGQNIPEIRLSSVHGEADVPPPDSGAKSLKTGRGQDSREFSDRGASALKTDKKSRDIVDLPGGGTPNLGQTLVRSEGAEAAAAHETTSDFREKLHEITSESAESVPERSHETESELRKTLHESKSDLAALASEKTHGTMGKDRESVHEMESESGGLALGAMHEIRSEVRDVLHEMESEFTDRVARGLLDGLRRAAAVR